MIRVRRVPWENKAEWLAVYEKSFNYQDLTDMKEAVQSMSTWIERGNCAPAVIYTSNFLQGMIRDSYFFPSVTSPETDENLQFQYSTSLLRFINILADVESAKSMSLNARALKVGLPEWVVNTRHQISHGEVLPSLEVLRISVKSLLGWLKENYWDIEKEAMDDLILENRYHLLNNNVKQLLKVYVHLMEMNPKQSIDSISDTEIKLILTSEFNDLLYHNFKKRICPWDLSVLPGIKYEDISKNIINCSVLKARILVTRCLTVYFQYEQGALDELLLFMLKDKHSKALQFGLWQSLFSSLHEKGKFPNIINKLLDVVGHEKSTYRRNAAMWTIQLLKSLLKGAKASNKYEKMFCASRPSAKYVNLGISDKLKDKLTTERIKQKLRYETWTDQACIHIRTASFVVIERQYPSLKIGFRLNAKATLTDRQIRKILTKILQNPNEFSPQLCKLLLGLSNTLDKATIMTLITLAEIKETLSINNSVSKLRNVFDSKQLAISLYSNEHCDSMSKSYDMEVADDTQYGE